MYLTIYISRFTELFLTISNDQLSVNNLVNLVALIVLNLRFTGLVRNQFAERDSLNFIKGFFLLLGLNQLNEFMNSFNNNSNQLFPLCHGDRFRNLNYFIVPDFMACF